MALPVVALCALGVLQLLGVARDALLAQDLARLGARTAATTPSDAAVRDAIVDAAGPDLRPEVRVTPASRGRGSTVTVTVTVRRPGGVFDVALTGRAVAHGEPQLDEADP